MTTEDWGAALDAFEKAIELATGPREEFLRDLALRHQALASPVKQLLADRASAQGWLEQSPVTPRSFFEPPDPYQPGTLVAGRYEMERRIGEGGVGVVYLAADLRLDRRPVVVKVLQDRWLRSPWMRGRFQREWQALARADHPNIVSVLDAGETTGGLAFIVMQYVPGVTVRSMIAGGPVPMDVAIRVIEQTGMALGALHARGILHRDLKPENLILSSAEDGRVKVVDFGLAEWAPTGSDRRATTVIFGTADYMAPEQLRGRASQASDIFALGVTAYEMLVGCRPFQAESPFDLPELHKRPVLPPSRTRLGISREADRLILSALHPDAKLRPSDAAQFGSELARTLRLPPGAAERITRRKWLALAPVVAAAGTGVGAWRIYATRALSEGERVIQYQGGKDPEEVGFTRSHSIQGTVVQNEARTGWGAWRMVSEDQGYYFRRLSGRQMAQALRLGWRLRAELKAESGWAFASLNSEGVPKRFDLCARRLSPNELMVVLVTRLSGSVEGPSVLVPESGWTALDLRYDPDSRHCTLSVDGTEKLSGYAGFSEFRENIGVNFGTSVYAAEKSSAVFRQVRLEIG